MKKRRVIVGVCLAFILGCSAAFANPPRYLLLETPRAPGGQRPTYGYYPGYGQPVRASTYTYGWFGVKPRRHWSRHFGYYRQYTEWSAR